MRSITKIRIPFNAPSADEFRKVLRVEEGLYNSVLSTWPESFHSWKTMHHTL